MKRLHLFGFIRSFIAVVAFNATEKEKHFGLSLGEESASLKISDRAIQTILINNQFTSDE